MHRIERDYATLLGLVVAPSGAEAATPRPSAPSATTKGDWVPLLASLALPPVIALVLLFGESPLLTVMLVLILLSSLLLAAAVLPPGLLARVQVPPSRFMRYRDRLALCAIGILAPITVFAVVVPLV